MKIPKVLLYLLLAFALLLFIVTVEKIAFAENPQVDYNIKFKDVKKSDWFYEGIKFMSEKDFMVGTDANKFSPKEATTRAAIVEILYRMDGSTKITGNKFKDVLPGTWYYNSVSWAADKKIVEGYGIELFGPEDSITREQMATILYRYAQYKDYDTTQGGMAIREFEDYENISEYALPTMAWTVNSGLIQGNDNKIMPSANATRGQVAVILMRFIEKIAQ